MLIVGGQVLTGGALVETPLRLDGEMIEAVGAAQANGRALDASGLLVLPGIVDIHGDAFERQLMPRPGVGFPVEVALRDSDRQAISNGITTVYHGVMASRRRGSQVCAASTTRARSSTRLSECGRCWRPIHVSTCAMKHSISMQRLW
jgi:alpha-D-ribose 1-methylphosphonate 5-triphosphate diphosphatase PhnM